MRYFVENLLSFNPQNLIPEALWAALAVYVLTLLACYASLLGSDQRFKWFWFIGLAVPFLGPVSYASKIIIAEKFGLKEYFYKPVNKRTPRKRA